MNADLIETENYLKNLFNELSRRNPRGDRELHYSQLVDMRAVTKGLLKAMGNYYFGHRSHVRVAVNHSVSMICHKDVDFLVSEIEIFDKNNPNLFHRSWYITVYGYDYLTCCITHAIPDDLPIDDGLIEFLEEPPDNVYGDIYWEFQEAMGR